jgi:hypothetical protein
MKARLMKALIMLTAGATALQLFGGGCGGGSGQWLKMLGDLAGDLIVLQAVD